MFLLDMFNSNKREWLKVKNFSQTSTNFIVIIDQFLLKDNIDFKIYTENSRMNRILNEDYTLEIWHLMNKLKEFPELEPVCSYSFQKYFSKDLMERAPGFPDWFYSAYPDVAIWFQNNLEELILAIGIKSEEDFEKYVINKQIKLELLRLIINHYKSVKGSLECQYFK